MNLSPQAIYTLQVASLFHDIGKYYVPDEILKKQGKLTDEEYATIQKHPADSASLLKDTFDKDILLAAGQHHERLDGSGYPHGLRSEEITIEAKIIAVADTYDAITSDRAYRKARTTEEALAELHRLENIHYDANVIQALQAALQEDAQLPLPRQP